MHLRKFLQPNKYPFINIHSRNPVSSHFYQAMVFHQSHQHCNPHLVCVSTFVASPLGGGGGCLSHGKTTKTGTVNTTERAKCSQWLRPAHPTTPIVRTDAPRVLLRAGAGEKYTVGERLADPGEGRIGPREGGCEPLRKRKQAGICLWLGVLSFHSMSTCDAQKLQTRTGQGVNYCATAALFFIN